MAITDTNDTNNTNNPNEQSPRSSFIKSLLKQVLIAFSIGAVVLALYLMIMSSESADKSVGKYAYTADRGTYMGKIRGQGRSSKSGGQVYFVQEPTGSVIEVPVNYVEMRDNPPKLEE